MTRQGLCYDFWLYLYIKWSVWEKEEGQQNYIFASHMNLNLTAENYIFYKIRKYPKSEIFKPISFIVMIIFIYLFI